MDLRNYFQRMRQIESEIAEPFVVVSSLDTPDGGKSGHAHGGRARSRSQVDR